MSAEKEAKIKVIRRCRRDATTSPKFLIPSTYNRRFRDLFFMRASLFAACTFLAMMPSIASGESESYGSYRYYDELPSVLFLVGKIKDGDSFELRRAMRDHEINLVVTASAGGSVYEALQMASILHDRSVGTYIPEDASCESSCAKIFLGGRKRMVLGELGVHQFYSGSPDAAAPGRKDVTTASTQYTTSDIIGILNEFDTPPFVYEKMFGTEDIYYFKSAEKQRLGLGIDDQNFLDQVAEVDKFLTVTPSALTRPDKPPVSPEKDQTARPAPSAQPPVPQSNPNGSNKFNNIDFFGMDLNSQGLRDVSLYQCENYCKRTPSCAAWSYVHATRWCWPKSGVENVSIAANVTSGIIDYSRINQDVFNRPFVEATGLDIPGYDLYPKGLRNMSLDQCRHACQATNDCVAFSYVPKQAWCFPKWGVGDYRRQLGIISGVINEN
ncbi:PAN domain-containing protein [Ruegeria arenilitoris]|uniref:PAN domain-containing protein n=1 Tax=Ruegeria arenilitoris TaxID=1173585 RepID=UPI001481540A|nr:PAN domain-containing protein [Ruegeria arenilitoris]